MSNLPITFWEKVDTIGHDGCWLWTGAKNAKGYGQMKMLGKTLSAYVLAFQDANNLPIGEPMLKGIAVHHKCKVKLCIRPSHLESVSYSVHSRIHSTKGKCREGHRFTGRKCKICYHRRMIRNLKRAIASHEISLTKLLINA